MELKTKRRDLSSFVETNVDVLMFTSSETISEDVKFSEIGFLQQLVTWCAFQEHTDLVIGNT